MKLPKKEDIFFNNPYDFSEFIQHYAKENNISIFDLIMYLNEEYEIDIDDMIKLLTNTLINIMKNDIKQSNIKLEDAFNN